MQLDLPQVHLKKSQEEVSSVLELRRTLYEYRVVRALQHQSQSEIRMSFMAHIRFKKDTYFLIDKPRAKAFNLDPSTRLCLYILNKRTLLLKVSQTGDIVTEIN